MHCGSLGTESLCSVLLFEASAVQATASSANVHQVDYVSRYRGLGNIHCRVKCREINSVCVCVLAYINIFIAICVNCV